MPHQIFISDIIFKKIDKSYISAIRRIDILGQNGHSRKLQATRFHYAFTLCTSYEKRLKFYFTLSPTKFPSVEQVKLKPSLYRHAGPKGEKSISSTYR
jgi:hypothetical protein